MPSTYIRRHDTHVYRVIHNHHYKSRPRRTPVVIHQHYSRPAPRQRTKTVIHKHYHQAPEAQPAPRVVHKHYRQPPPRTATDRPQIVAPRQPDYRQRQQVPSTYQSPPVEDIRQASPAPKIRNQGQPQQAVTSGKAVQKSYAKTVIGKKKGHKKGHKKRAKKNQGVDVSEQEYLTSAPHENEGDNETILDESEQEYFSSPPYKKRGRGRSHHDDPKDGPFQ
jgi:hypothetical protein